jgi:hypothetical protein
MKKNILRPSALLLAGLLWAGLTQAQESINAAGGDASGAGGTVAYSVGQLVHTTHAGTPGSLAQGVQQPFEISVVTGMEETAIQLELNAYPNPATHTLTLQVSAYAGLHLQLTDLRGVHILRQELTSNSTDISMDGLAQAVYFLTVSGEDQVIKTFKITKI